MLTSQFWGCIIINCVDGRPIKWNFGCVFAGQMDVTFSLAAQKLAWHDSTSIIGSTRYSLLWEHLRSLCLHLLTECQATIIIRAWLIDESRPSLQEMQAWEEEVVRYHGTGMGFPCFPYPGRPTVHQRDVRLGLGCREDN
jgi:hypothetical protein